MTGLSFRLVFSHPCCRGNDQNLTLILAERVYKFVARTQRTYHARIASELWFRFGHKSFYRFGIRSCLATSHKQILKVPFNMTSSCTLGFQATRPATWAHFIHSLFIYCTLVNPKVFLGQITAGCKHNTARLDKWLEILAVEGLAQKERWPELQREQQRRRPVR